MDSSSIPPAAAQYRYSSEYHFVNKAKFYDVARHTVFGGSLKQTQVDGIEALLAACADHRVSDPRHIAYVLATPVIETGNSFEPISENLNYSAEGLRKTFPKYFSLVDSVAYARQPQRIANRAYGGRMGNGPEATGDGWRYRGRGFVQITGKDNYSKFSGILGIDLVGNPDRAMETKIAASIAVRGMRDGIFTGKRLSDYFGSGTDWVNARRIINGTDRAQEIGRYALAFHAAIKGAA